MQKLERNWNTEMSEIIVKQSDREGESSAEKMAALIKAVQAGTSMNGITKLFTNLSLAPGVIAPAKHAFLRRFVSHPPRAAILVSCVTSSGPPVSLRPQCNFPSFAPALHCAFIHLTSGRRDLMEFFDDPKNWGKNEVRVGRSWKKDELRLKSNSDLHKLWYVLLKERNMLMTMEEACNRAFEILPNPERLDKIQDSMSNLESVVRERNRAYHLLETGETGERPGKLVYNILGLRFYYRMSQHNIPKFVNTKWHKLHMFGYGGYATRKFLRLYREQLWNKKRRARTRDNNRVAMLMRKFPNLDLEAVKEQFPNVNVEKVKESRRARSHTVPA